MRLRFGGVIGRSTNNFDYPKPRKADQIDDFHGTKVADPYRWMEDTDSAETQCVDRCARTSSPRRISQRSRSVKRSRIGLPRSGTTSVFGAVQGRQLLYLLEERRASEPERAVQSDVDRRSRPVFFDPNKILDDGTAALNGSAFTDDGKFWAYGVANAGSDRTEWHVMDIATGKTPARHACAESPGRHRVAQRQFGLLLQQLPAVEKGSELKGNTFFQKIYFHKLGTPQSDD